MMKKSRLAPLFARSAISAAILAMGWLFAPAQAGTPAFPGVEGAGMNATGGRGGTVVHVTNLRAHGPGSFADAVDGPNRIVVFDVSGIIDLSGTKGGGKIAMEHPNITIAGQTAPGEGICLKGGCLHISAGNVIVRHIRSRRGWIFDRDTGDAIEVKPPSIGEVTKPNGQTAAALDKRKLKKAERGKIVHDFAEMSDIVIDHCSTSWATDENLTVTHADRTTVSWSIAAEGCDYANAKQTPPNHSEGSLWGSQAADGRATMHHVLYAHNRLRNPRTTGGDGVPAVLTFYNNVVYDWREYASHTGAERVRLNWLNNFYKPGPSTPAEVRAHMFEFHGDAGAQIFASGNFIDGAPEATADNKLAIFHNQKFKKIPVPQREAMKVDAPFGEMPPRMETAPQALASVLAEAGATLPARDPVDLRITNAVRRGGGKIIGKETDLAGDLRWPDYRSLPPPQDSDGDGLPDFWEKQFALDPADAKDSGKLAADGYANIEHYCNNTDPRGGRAPIVCVAATVSRAHPRQPGEWKIMRTGDLTQALIVRFDLGGDAQASRDFAPVADSVTIPAEQSSAAVRVTARDGARVGSMVVLRLKTGEPAWHAGCPSASLVVMEK